MFKSNQYIYVCIYYHSAQNFIIVYYIFRDRVESRRTEGSINIDMNKYVLKKKPTCLSLTL